MVAQQASDSLMTIGPAVVHCLVRKLEEAETNNKTRARILLVIEGIGPDAKAAIPTILWILRETHEERDYNVRTSAVRALIAFGAESATAVPLLDSLLINGKGSYLRALSARALGSVGEDAREAVPSLFSVMMLDTDQDVGVQAEYALSDVGIGALPFIISVLQDSSENTHVLYEISYILLRMGRDAQGASQAAAKIAANRALPGWLRANYIHMLGNLGEKAQFTISQLIEGMREQDREVMWASRDALAKVGSSAVDELIPVLQDTTEALEVRKGSAYALGEMKGEATAAVPSLVSELKEFLACQEYTHIGGDSLWIYLENWEVIQEIVVALGKIGAPAKEAIPVIWEARNSACTNVRDSSIKALVRLAESLQEARDTEYLDTLSSILVALVHDFPSSPILPSYHSTWINEEIGRLRRAVVALQVMREHEKPDWLTTLLNSEYGDYIRIGFIIIIVYLVFLVVCGFLLLFRPLALLGLFNGLRKVTDLPVSKWLIPFILLQRVFQYHSRVLQAWVEAHIDTARKQFESKQIVSERRVYVPLPVSLNGSPLISLGSRELGRVFAQKPTRLVIWGEGGAGKTSLALQIAKAGMSQDASQRAIDEHLTIPILLDDDPNLEQGAPNTAFLQAVRGELKSMVCSKNPIDLNLTVELMRKSFLLVLVDHFSELSNRSRQALNVKNPDFPANALIITSRMHESLSGVQKFSLVPQRVHGKHLTDFVDSYLRALQQRQSFSDDEYLDHCLRLTKMVGERSITPLLAKLYVDQMVARKAGKRDEDLPQDIPELMLRYVSLINTTTNTGQIDDRKLLAVLKVAAWHCVKDSLQLGNGKFEAIVKELSNVNDGETILKSSAEQLKLIRLFGVRKNFVRFELDPLAEYLAAWYVVEHYSNNEPSWTSFLSQADALNLGNLHAGEFLAAVWDCCTTHGPEFNVPESVTAELKRRLSPPATSSPDS